MSQFGQASPNSNTGGPDYGPGAHNFGPGAQHSDPASAQFNTGAYRFRPEPAPSPPRRAGRVRPYALTSGRTQPAVDLPMEAVIETISYHAQFDWPSGDIRAEILRLGTHQLSVAEIAAHLDRPLGMVRVVIGDLVVDGNLRVHSTLTEQASYDERRSLMERTLRGLRAL